MTDPINVHSYNEYLDSEIRTIVNEDNDDFLRTYCGLIPDVVNRSYWRVRRLKPAEVLRLYCHLAFELALCAEQLGAYRDKTLAIICINLRLQRRLDRLLTRSHRSQEIPKPESRSAEIKKPKFSAPRLNVA